MLACSPSGGKGSWQWPRSGDLVAQNRAAGVLWHCDIRVQNITKFRRLRQADGAQGNNWRIRPACAATPEEMHRCKHMP